MASSSDESGGDLPRELATDMESGRKTAAGGGKTSSGTTRAAVSAEVRHYAPLTDDEKRLDQRINAKLDAVVLFILSVSFVVSFMSLESPVFPAQCEADMPPSQLCGIDKTNIGFVATSTFIKDANLNPDDIPNSLSLVASPPVARLVCPTAPAILPLLALQPSPHTTSASSPRLTKPPLLPNSSRQLTSHFSRSRSSQRAASARRDGSRRS